MNFIFNEDIILKNISFNKSTGFCIFNTDLTMFTDNEYKDLIEQKASTPLRLTKNISHYLNITSIYGIIPGIFYFSSKALINKSNILKSILKISLDNGNINYQKIEKIANNYINKFKYLINIKEDKDYFLINNNYMDVEENNNEENKSIQNIFELIENSLSDDKLKKKPIDYEAWF